MKQEAQKPLLKKWASSKPRLKKMPYFCNLQQVARPKQATQKPTSYTDNSLL